MRAVECVALGEPSGLVVVERPDPTPNGGQVVIQVEAAGVNFVDALFVRGHYQIKPPVPFTPGSEVAGTISAVGDGVTYPTVGQRVLAMSGLGGYATHVVVQATQAVVVPDALDTPRAASFMQSYCTALFALRERARLDVGETVLVLGAGGGVGLATIDVAVALGGRAIGVASTADKRAEALAMGAFAVIDPTTEDLKIRTRELTDGAGADLVMDTVGGDLAEPALRAMALFGRYLVIGFASGTIPRLPLNQVLLRNRSIVGVDWGAWAMANGLANLNLLGDALAMVERGRLHPVAPTAYPLADVARALDDVEQRRVAGKVVLVP